VGRNIASGALISLTKHDLARKAHGPVQQFGRLWRCFGDGEAESAIDRIGADVTILREHERPTLGGRQVLANSDLVDTRPVPIHLPQLHDASSAKRGSSMRWVCCSEDLVFRDQLF